MHRALLRRLNILSHHNRALSFSGLFMLVGILMLAVGAFSVMKLSGQIAPLVPLTDQQLFLSCGVGCIIGGVYILLHSIIRKSTHL